jgi:hypothetical protein
MTERETFARAAVLVLAAAMPLAVLGLILRYGVNVPEWDEWAWTTLIVASHDGGLTFAQLWAPNNEHRIFVTDLVMLALAHLGGWNVVREEIFTLLLFVGCQVILWRLIRRTVDGRIAPVVFLCTSALLYSLGQWENIVSGYQMGWAICDVALFATALLLTDPGRSAKHVAVAVVLAFAASYSVSQGLLTWLAGVLWLWFPRRRLHGALALWTVGAIVAVALDRIGSPTNAGVPHAELGDVQRLLAYALAYLGAPLAGWAGAGPSMAVGVLAATVVLVFVLVDARDVSGAGFQRRLPWYGFIAYAVAAALVTGYARDVGGPGQALSSRYMTVSSLLFIALVAMLAPCALDVARPALRLATRLAIVGITLATIPASMFGFRSIQSNAVARTADLAAIRAGDVAAAADAFPDQAVLAEWVGELRKLQEGPFRR